MADHSEPLRRKKDELDQHTERVGTLARDLEDERRARERAREGLLTIVQAARQDGMTWEAVGAALGMTAQGAQQFYRRGAGG